MRATELIRSTDFGTSHTLRFPRVIKIREDKPVNDVMTLDEFDNLVAVSIRNEIGFLTEETGELERVL